MPDDQMTTPLGPVFAYAADAERFWLTTGRFAVRGCR